MQSLHTQDADTGKQPAVLAASHPPPFPSLRSLDLDVADFWSHSILQQPIEGNVEALFEELEKIIPRLTPLAPSYEEDEDMTVSMTEEDSNDDDNAEDNTKIRKTEQSVALRMRMLEVWQEVLTLEFQEDSENDHNTLLVFPDPTAAAENFSNVRNRLQVLCEKLNARKKQSSDDDYHNLCRSLLALEYVMDSEASLAAIIRPRSASKQSKGASAIKSPAATKAEWLDQLSEIMKSLTKTFLDDKAPVPDALVSVTSFVLQRVAARQTRESQESPPSPSPLTQDSAIADRHNDDDVSDDDIARVQRGLQNLYGRPASPFYIVQLQEDTRQLLLHWSTQDLEIPKLIQLGYLTGKRITSTAAHTTSSSTNNTSFDTAVRGTRVDVEVQTEAVKQTNNKAMNTEKQGVARLPQKENAKKAAYSKDHDSDSETTLGETDHKKPQGRTSEVVHQIWGSSKKRRKAADGPSFTNEGDDGGKKKRATGGKHISPRSQVDPPASSAGTTARSPAQRKSRPNLKPPPQYPSQKKPAPSPSPQKSAKTSSMQPSSDVVEDDGHKRKATGNKQAGHRRTSDPAIRVETHRKSTSKKRARSQEPAVAKKQPHKKQKRKSIPTEADVLEAIRLGIEKYGTGNWTMIRKRSGGKLKHLTGSQIKEISGMLPALSVSSSQ